jgi:hypothetical protein
MLSVEAMLHPEHFVLIIAVLLGLFGAWVLLLGAANRRRSGTAGRERIRRDVIADGTVSERAVDEMLAAENARLREQGRPERSRADLEARVVGDRRERFRLLRLRLRRR